MPGDLARAGGELSPTAPGGSVTAGPARARPARRGGRRTGEGWARSVEVPHRRQWVRRHATILVLLDAIAATAAAITAYVVRFSDFPSEAEAVGPVGYIRSADGYVWFSVALPALWVVTVGLAHAYDGRYIGYGLEEFQRVIHAFVVLTAAVAFVSYATKAEVARGYVVLALPLTTVLSLLGHYAARKRLHVLRRAGQCLQSVVAVGDEHSVAELVTQLRRESYAGMRVIGACVPQDRPAERIIALGVPVLGSLDDVAAVVARTGADTVAVTACAEMDPMRLRRLSWQLEGTDTDLVVAPGLIEVAGPRLHIRPVTGLPLLHVEEPYFTGGRRLVKGATDRICAAVALVLLAPLLVVIGLAVRLTSPGPALFRQTRIGKDGRTFTMLKFRTMTVDAERQRDALIHRNDRAEGLLFKIRDDPRVTPLGRLLRRFSLDELPQLVNVLTGSMSLVGPRPPLPSEVELYEDHVRRRLLVKPGMTGLWQISGRSDLTWDESVRLDLRYVENWSLTLDFVILCKTVFAVARGSGAY